MKATLSILGLHNATEGAIWDELSVPEGVDQDVLVMSILAECAELEVLYPEPTTMGTIIGLWSAAELPIWRKLYATTQLDYNPIWNKDGTVTETESRSHIGVDNGSGDETFKSEGSSSRDQSDSAERSGEITQQVSAYDANTFQNREKENNSDETSASSTEHVIADNENQTERSDNQDTYDADDRTYERRETGNIGVTTTQQMIKEEREVDQFNIYDYIVQSFKRRFCLLVY